MDDPNIDLVGETDAQKWAKRWIEIIKENPGIPTDEECMVGWFANAIMSGYDQGRRDERRNFIEGRLDRIEKAISAMASWLVQAQTGFGIQDARGIEKILRGEDG